MKSIKKMIGIFAVVGVLGVAGMVYAEGSKLPGDVAAALTGKSLTDVNKERANGKTYGSIAKEAGKLDEFKAQMLEQRKAALDNQVKAGRITQEQADQIYNNIKNNQALCDGTGNAKPGSRQGLGCGMGKGQGFGKGQGVGRGTGNGGCRNTGAGMGYNR